MASISPGGGGGQPSGGHGKDRRVSNWVLGADCESSPPPGSPWARHRLLCCALGAEPSAFRNFAEVGALGVHRDRAARPLWVKSKSQKSKAKSQRQKCISAVAICGWCCARSPIDYVSELKGRSNVSTSGLGGLVEERTLVSCCNAKHVPAGRRDVLCTLRSRFAHPSWGGVEMSKFSIAVRSVQYHLIFFDNASLWGGPAGSPAGHHKVPIS